MIIYHDENHTNTTYCVPYVYEIGNDSKKYYATLWYRERNTIARSFINTELFMIQLKKSLVKLKLTAHTSSSQNIV